MEQLEEKASNKVTHTTKKVSQRKPPVVKQTLTSMYRIAKANPLMTLTSGTNVDTQNGFSLSNIKLPKSVLQSTPRYISDNAKLVVNSGQFSSNFSAKTSSAIKTNGDRNKPKDELTDTKAKQWKRTNSIKRQPPTSKPGPKTETQSNSNNGTKTLKPAVAVKKEKRRSLSAEHYERKKEFQKNKTAQLMDTNDVGGFLPPGISPIVEEKRTVVFKTPAHQRRSISLTSITPTPFHRYCASTPGPTAFHLQQNLEKWLKNNKKSIDSYKHLKCFGLHRPSHDNFTQPGEENKENIEDSQNTCLARSTSYDDLKIISENSSETPIASQNKNNYADSRTIAEDALIDLHKLILAGYPHSHCEAWLEIIRQKYQDLDEEPQYWECRAAIEQTRGNITSAVDHLRTAIIQGAEVKAVDHSLEQLLQKFSLLNISTSDQDNNEIKRKDRERIVLDARNVFKSSIIQFAVQARKLKKKNLQVPSSTKNYTATPVRRSTRESRSRYTSTPSVKLCSSLRELDENISNSLDFHSNNALFGKLHH